MTYAVKFSWHEPVGQFRTKAAAQQYAKAMRDQNRQAGLRGVVKVIKTGKRNPSKRSTVKRVSKALTKYVRGVIGKKNPWKPAAPVPLGHGYSLKAGYGDYWVTLAGEKVGTVNGGYYQTRRDVLAEARAIAKEHRAKSTRRNPGRRHYQVNVPATRSDRGYLVKVLAPSAASAKAAARKYCANRQGVPVSQFHLPKGTKAKVI